MAGKNIDIAATAAALIEDAKKGIFKPLYVLMGEEPFYPDLICDAIIANCIPEEEQDFNQIICYGSDTDAETVTFRGKALAVIRSGYESGEVTVSVSGAGLPEEQAVLTAKTAET